MKISDSLKQLLLAMAAALVESRSAAGLLLAMAEALVESRSAAGLLAMAADLVELTNVEGMEQVHDELVKAADDFEADSD